MIFFCFASVYIMGDGVYSLRGLILGKVMLVFLSGIFLQVQLNDRSGDNEVEEKGKSWRKGGIFCRYI